MTEPIGGQFVYTPVGRVGFGRGCLKHLPAELDRLKKRRAVVISSRTLARGEALARVRELLGARYAGAFTEPEVHVPRSSAVRAANACRQLDADVLVTLGGSTCIDAARAAGILVKNSPGTTLEDDWATFDRYRVRYSYANEPEMPELSNPPLPIVAIQTTLSGGEFTSILAVTNDESRTKELFVDPGLAPHSVILDPDMTRWTPESLWFSTGIKAMDHAIESIYSRRHMPVTDSLGAKGISLLARNLAGSQDVEDVAARLNCQLGAWLAMFGVYPSVGVGIGHAIGHQLGSRAGVPHGIAAAVMLPHAMEYNREAAGHRLQLIAQALGVADGNTPASEAADRAIAAVRELVGRLGLPQRLRDAGVPVEALPGVAGDTWTDIVIATNPREVRGPEEILELLRRAW